MLTMFFEVDQAIEHGHWYDLILLTEYFKQAYYERHR
jgi:hypothetical protein